MISNAWFLILILTKKLPMKASLPRFEEGIKKHQLVFVGSLWSGSARQSFFPPELCWIYCPWRVCMSATYRSHQFYSFHPQTLNVWYICLHLTLISGRCRYKYDFKIYIYIYPALRNVKDKKTKYVPIPPMVSW